MRKLIGPHLAGQWANKLEILRKWQPSLALVLSPDADKVQQLRDACPNTMVVGRFFHDDSHYASNINARPKEFAHEIHQEIVNNPVTPLLDYVQSNNETNQDWQGIQQLNVFTQEWMFLADQSQAYRCAILAFSVGNPDLPNKPGDPAGFDGHMLYWQQVLPSLNYAQRNGHILGLHAYGYPDMFHPDADWYLYRYERQVQANLRTLGITNLKYAYLETGIDRLIVNGKGGYKVVPTTDESYVNQHLQWEKDLQGEDMLLGGAIFTLGDSGGWDTYDIASTNVASMIAEHYVEHAGDYNVDSANHDNDIFIPTVSTGTKPQEPALPPRDVDPRAIERGVTVYTPPIEAGKPYWRAARIDWLDEQESQGRHHILGNVRENGVLQAGISLVVRWPGGDADIKTEDKSKDPPPFNYWYNFPMSPSLNEYSIEVWHGPRSEVVKGIGMGADGNSHVHTSTVVEWELATMPAIGTQPAPSPAPSGPTVTAKFERGANIRSGPGLQYPVLGAEPMGTVMPVIGRLSDWWLVDMPHIEGWVSNTVVLSYGIEDVPFVAAPVVGDPQPPQPVGDCWERSRAFVAKWEGDYSDNPEDHGNWTGGRKGVGELKGTRYGISAASYPQLDIRNLTMAEADAIYFRDYWQASNAASLPWPYCLLAFDTAVLHGVGTSLKWQQEAGDSPYVFAAKRLRTYTKLDNWNVFGAGWVNRVADLLTEASN